MKISQAAKIWIEYHVNNSKKNTVRAYRWIINKFCADFREEELAELSSLKIQRAEKSRRLYLFLKKWPTGCGSMPGKIDVLNCFVGITDFR